MVIERSNIAKALLFEALISRLGLSQNKNYAVLDFGCGNGDFLGLLSEQIGAKSKLIGIDANDGFKRGALDSTIVFKCDKFSKKLAFPNASFDIIVTIDVIECITDKERLINEFHRMLRPSGKVMAAHWDWDTMLYNAESKDIAARAVAAFSGWKQPWMENFDSQMGRKLWGLFEGSGKFHGKPDSFSYIEADYKPGKYGFDRMADIARLVGKGGIRRDEYDQLHSELMMKDGNREYFFCLTSFIYTGEKA